MKDPLQVCSWPESRNFFMTPHANLVHLLELDVQILRKTFTSGGTSSLTIPGMIICNLFFHSCNFLSFN